MYYCLTSLTRGTSTLPIVPGAEALEKRAGSYPRSRRPRAVSRMVGMGRVRTELLEPMRAPLLEGIVCS